MNINDRVTPAASMPLGTEDSNTFGTITGFDREGGARYVWVRWDRNPRCELAHRWHEVKDASLADIIDTLPLASAI